MNARPAWVPPERFDEYQLVQALGRGGMGTVYLAQDTMLDRLVAIKFIASLDRNEAARQRFFVEARAAARLAHPNVVAVHRVGELLGRPYLVAEFVRGQSLDKVARPVPNTQLLKISIDLARGLAAAHRRGVLHRDIKPANAILAESGEVKLLDFGLAKLLDLGEAERSHSTPVPEAVAVPSATPDPNSTLPAIPPPPLEESRELGERETQAAGPRVDSDMTAEGTMMGTPTYMSPEAWRGELATPQSDIYSLGIMLFELASGAPPFRGDAVAIKLSVTNGEPPRLLDRAPEIDPRFASVVDHCLRRNPSDRYASADALREALERLTDDPAADERATGNPYRGLAPFEAEHRSLFFGRDPAIRAVVDRLVSEPFVLIAGDSGVGKSSLCSAGVLPRICEGALGGQRRFTTVTLRPGRRPLAAITAALGSFLGASVDDLDDGENVARHIRSALGSEKGLVVFVDQLEELLTLADPVEADAAASLLASLAVRCPQLRLLATVRGDFLTRLTRLQAFASEIERAIYLLAPLSPDAIRDVILGPAAATGTKFESEAMVDEIVAATSDADGGLPLLQFALADLWDARDPDTQTITARSLAAMGGVAGALARHADAVVASMLPGPRTAARSVLVRLVTGAGTRARRSEAELVADDPDARSAVEALVRGRLVVAREDGGGTAYEVAHEALIQSWTALRNWLHDEGDRRIVHERLGAAAAEWKRHGRANDLLLRDRQLGEVSTLPVAQLTAIERELVERSRRAVRRRRIARGAIIVAVPLIGIGVYAGVRLEQQRDLERRVDRQLDEASATLAGARARNREIETERRAAFDAFDAHHDDAGESHWSRALALTSETNKLYSEASRAAESAVTIDPERTDSRTMLADILYERATIAERDHDTTGQDEFLTRLVGYDPGDRRARWTAPATLSVESPCEVVRVERFAEAGWQAVDRKACPARLMLPPGSYRLTLSASNRIDVVEPVLLARGESIVVAPPMPRPAEVPAGVVFIPGGRFLRGSTSPESHRKGFESAPPLHTSVVKPFFIAKYELTFGEWIEFLEALPASEREKHRPLVSSPGVQGYVELRGGPGGWELAMQPGSIGFFAHRDERIREQDWTRMPVSGISREDIDAYLLWLRQRIPGARLCSDEEWEFASRGADGRLYPHGDRLDVGDANVARGTDELTGPDEVGRHPRSVSVFGVYDLAGNVFDLVGDGTTQVVRGGAFAWDDAAARVQTRSAVQLTYRANSIGTRLCGTYSRP